MGVSTWAQKAVVVAVEHGMIAGYPDNTMKPQAHATRAESVTVILKAIEKKSNDPKSMSHFIGKG
ncbi:S-layer homology domain-containing protein [Paenibacillus sp. NPDC057967]|uniref:S-layer homology domain-containing protein n=1 Tax=Paenibacillus sp. NPDC057967 TaxID=3346293 RepID=UPI0036DC8202